MEPATLSESSCRRVRRLRTLGGCLEATSVRILAVVLSSAWLGHTGVARAAVAPNLSLSLTGCAEAQVPSDRLFELLRTEVAPATLGVAGASLSPAVPATIELCHGSAQLVWMTLGPREPGSLERIVDLSDVVGELRARTLAVAFAEMLTMLPAPIAPVPVNPISQSPASGSDPSRWAPSRPASEISPHPPSAHQNHSGLNRPRVGAGLALREFSSPSTTSIGPWLSMASGPWQAELLFLEASREVSAGTVTLRELSAAGVYAPLQLGTAFRTVLGLRGELGLSWASGTPGTNRQAIGTAEHRVRAAGLVEPRLEVPIASALLIQARLACGVAYGPTATANGNPAVKGGGAFVGTALGMVAVF